MLKISDHFQDGYRFGSAYDLAARIGPDGITRLLEIVCDAYDMLCKNNTIKKEMSEDDITEELFKEIVIIWCESSTTNSIVPINQKSDKTFSKDVGKPPTIDFCFRDRYVRESFFGFECKLLAEGDVRLYREYIQNGLYRYIQGKYCARSSAGSLIGYVTSGSISVVVQDVKIRVDKKNILSAMALAPSISTFKEHYTSTHTREKGLSSFCVHHLFFRFTTVN